MTVQLNHTFVWCPDPERSSTFLAEILGRPAPTPFGLFHVVELDNGASLDFMKSDGDAPFQHYAFLVEEDEFDRIFGRICDRGMEYWADPARTEPGKINHHFGGRGVYFHDPDGRLLEIITRPYDLGA
ncbi:MAG: hypothetical protein QOD06_1208 [Candidatus Binatota bacterium]|jgi:catechol 2,3-dioxygenase-like lactoylglutathione lyase family enzyme|nr:hypothetical protein [Candidatus Binatota bacterium]